MFENKPNEDEFDLSDMIDEYDEDQELRKKIEAMKQEQAQKQVSPIEEEPINPADTALMKKPQSISNTRELPKYEEQVNRNSFLNADDSEATRVMSREEDGYDKTLVIMNNQKQRTFVPEQEEEADDSIYMYDNREVDEEEITDEDIEEFLDEDQKEKKPKKSMDPNKMNKIITYVIIGVVSVCLVVGIGFGAKMMIDSFGGYEKPTTEPKDPKPENPTKPDDNGGTTKPSEGDKPNENPQGNEGSTDNGKRIAEINGLIKGYQDQIDELNGYIQTADEIIKAAPENIAKAEKDIDYYNNTVLPSLEAACINADGEYNRKKAALDEANKNLAAKPEDAALKQKVETAQKEHDDALMVKQTSDTARDEAKKSSQAASDAKTKAETEKASAEENKTSYQNQITELQNKIRDLQNERETLQ